MSGLVKIRFDFFLISPRASRGVSPS